MTAAAARAVDREVDLRWAALLAVAPDAVDKSVAWLAPALVHHNTRNFGHTLLGALAVFAALTALRRRVRLPALLAACYAGHLVLDLMWLNDNPAVLFWPLLGPFPPTAHDPVLNQRLFLYNLFGELAGLAALIALVRGAGERQRGVR